MKKIIFGITSLTLGGAERVLVDIVNELSLKYDITIFTIYGNGEFEKELSNKVTLINMLDKSFDQIDNKEKMKISLKLLFNKNTIYKKYINNGYDIEIAFLEGPITRLFSVENNRTRKIAWIHNDIRKVFGQGIKAKIKKKLDKGVYSKYNDLIFVSNDNKKCFESIYSLSNNKLVIPNYISSKRVIDKSKVEIEKVFYEGQPNFLTVSRLTKQKGIDRLIKVHKKLIEDGFSHKFYVIGDGPEKNNLKKLIMEFHVEETFILLGKKENPYPYIKSCDIFALLSYYEGFPMTILESKILNKPILITDTASREAVGNYYKSYITENSEEGIYNGIKNSINKLSNWENINDIVEKENVDILKNIEKLVK